MSLTNGSDDVRRRSEAMLSRRQLLNSAVAAGITSGLAGCEHSIEGVAESTPGSSGGESGRTEGISLRAIWEAMDPEIYLLRPQRDQKQNQKQRLSIRGNGPPWAGRPGMSAEELCSYQSDGERTRYVKHPRASRKNAYDLGMMNRDKKGVKAPLMEKGLLEMHRWPDVSDSFRTQQSGTKDPTRTYSVRSFTNRHKNGVRHKILWQNIKMPQPLPGRKKRWKKRRIRRAEALGELFGRDDYDIVAMCEVFKKEYLQSIEEKWANEHNEVNDIHEDWTGKPPGDFGGGVAENGERTVDYSGGMFDSNHGSNNEGWQRFDVKLPREIFGDKVGFEIITTHLDAHNEPRDLKIRHNQLNELVDIIENRQNKRCNWPKILMGDLNIHSTKERKLCGNFVGKWEPADKDCIRISHRYLLERMSDVDMQDAWQTYGGPARRTVKGKCKTKDDPDEEICRCKDFHKMGGNRLDYVFVEKPKHHHDIHLDFSRMWRTAWHKHCYTAQQMGMYEDAFVIEGNRLTDHHGIGFELLTSPKQ